MNKFKSLANKLISNSLWCSNITYKMYQKIRNQLTQTIVLRKSVDMKVVVKSVNHNLVDNVNIFTSDKSIVIDNTTLQRNPSKYDIVIINQQQHKIVGIYPLGTLNNQPTAYQIILRIA